VKFKQERIKTLIIQEVMKAITSGEVKDPRIPMILTITDITLSKDLHYCHLYFSMIGNDADKKKAVSGLNSAAGFFQKILGEKLELRFTPKMEFRYDQKEEESQKVYGLLKKLEQERLEKENK
jgi:ribosome-binding factor A